MTTLDFPMADLKMQVHKFQGFRQVQRPPVGEFCGNTCVRAVQCYRYRKALQFHKSLEAQRLM